MKDIVTQMKIPVLFSGLKAIKRFKSYLVRLICFLMIIFLFLMPIHSFLFFPVLSVEKEIEKIRLSFVGDIMVHKQQIAAAWNCSSKNYDFAPQFSWIKPLLCSSDIVAGNLETTFGGPSKGYSGYPCFNSPDSLAHALKEAGFDLLFTANNHCLDSRADGLARTIRVLEKESLMHTGTFLSKEKRDEVLCIEKGSIKIAFLNYTYGINGFSPPSGKEWMVNRISPEKIEKDLQAARLLSPDLIVVYLHFGNEYQQKPTNAQSDLARSLIRSGVDIVMGSHPHVLQPLELFSSKPDSLQCVAYSLGNIISMQRTFPRDTGCILNVDIEKDLSSKARIRAVTVIPTWVQCRKTKQGRVIRTIAIKRSYWKEESNNSQVFQGWEKDRMKRSLKCIESVLEPFEAEPSPDSFEFVVWSYRQSQ